MTKYLYIDTQTDLPLEACPQFSPNYSKRSTASPAGRDDLRAYCPAQLSHTRGGGTEGTMGQREGGLGEDGGGTYCAETSHWEGIGECEWGREWEWGSAQRVCY